MPIELRAATTELTPPERKDASFVLPHHNALLTWLFAIVAPSLAFLTLTAPSLAIRAIPQIALIFVLLSTALMALTAFTNPGTIPMPSERQTAQNHPSHHVVNGVRIPVKFCTVCGLARPPRASHCRKTDRCIDRWDHYCPWVGNAVGRDNYRWFVFFLASTCSLAAVVGIGSLLHLRTLAASSVVGAIEAAPASALLLIYTSIVLFLLTMLLTYHLYIIAINQTTYENVRGRWTSEEPNPFDRGLLANFGEFLCPSCVPPVPWSVVDYETGLPPPTDMQAVVDEKT